jgi:hypothetical protein
MGKCGEYFTGRNSKLLFNFEKNFRGKIKNMQERALGESKS